LKEKCVYALVFETQVALNPPEGARIASPPHPFVIEPPQGSDTHFPKGASFDFHLLLFGEVNHSLPYFIYALDRMGKIGIGKKVNGKRGRFSLEAVVHNGRTIYSGQDQRLLMPESPEVLSLSHPKDAPKGGFRLRLTLETPLRLKFRNRLKADLPFHVLTRAMLRRISSLFTCYGHGEPALDYPGLVKRAEAVRVVNSDLRWFDWRRYSLRQDQGMLMGGMLGSVTYEGKMGDYLPLLDLCSKLHLGKQTAFGLGKIEITDF